MWKSKRGVKYLDRLKVNKSEFNIKLGSIDNSDYYLICPKRNKYEWTDDERWLRSVVVDNTGRVVSCGWPKFGNWDEFSSDTQILKERLASDSQVLWTHKEDGSLAIRSVINNEIIFRTRGTLFGGERGEDGTESFRERFFRVAQNKYPKLLDKDWMTNRSLLFEYVSPSNLVVVQYKEEDLVFIGFVDHGLHIGHWHELERVAQEGELNLVRLHDLPRDPIKLLEVIKVWKDEGIVARCDQDQILIKVKSAHYLAQHRMKFSINYRFMVEFAELSDIKTESELVTELRACDYDFEVIQTVLPFFHRYKKAVTFVDNIIFQAREIVNNFSSKETTEAGKRKELAISVKDKGLVRPFVFALYDNKLNRVWTLRRKIVLNEGKR